MIYDYVIIGGGISGIAAARLLQLSGVERVAVLEAEAEPGGLCRTREIGGHVLDTGGGHFLCTKYPEVYAFVFAHIARTEFNWFDRISRVAINGTEVDYPLESNLWQLPRRACAEYLVSLAQNGEARGLPAPADFEGWIRWKLGDRIAEDYMLPYNRKIWGVPAAEMDTDWLHKIPRVQVREVLEACLARAADPVHLPSHAGFYYPKRGGFQRVFDALADPVRDLIHTGTPVRSLERIGDTLVVNGRLRARAVINTAPWTTLLDSPLLRGEAATAARRLRHNEIVVSLHEGGDAATDAHWRYEPDERLTHHRTFFIPNFAPHSAAGGFYRETNGQRWHAGAAGEIFAASNPFAYPIPAIGWAAAIESVLTQARQHGVHGLGRWGQWQYFNSDVCLREAMLLVDRLGHRSWRQLIDQQAAA